MDPVSAAATEMVVDAAITYGINYGLRKGHKYVKKKLRPTKLKRSEYFSVDNVKIDQMVNPRKGKKVTRRMPGAVQQDVKALQKQMKLLKTSRKAEVAYHTRKTFTSGVITSNENEQAWSNQIVQNLTTLEATMNSLRFFDIAAPTTLVTASIVSGNFSRKVSVKNVGMHLTVRNNYILPCNATFYLCTPREDQNIHPVSAITGGLADQMTTSVTANSIGVYPSDSDMFKKFWKIEKTTKKTFAPGQEFEYKYNTGQFTYNPSIGDSDTDEYQKDYKSAILMVRVQGILAHDSALGQYGFAQGSLDYVNCVTTKIEYDSGGVSLNDYSYTNNDLDAFTNTAIATNRSVADNQSYSAA